jgi:hypothetical protein
MINLPLILAQAGPGAVVPMEPVSGFYNLLLNNGLMGGAVALLIFLLIKRDSELQKSQEGRLEDSKTLALIVRDHTVALAATNVANEERNRALEISSRAAEKFVVIIEQLVKEVAGLKGDKK